MIADALCHRIDLCRPPHLIILVVLPVRVCIVIVHNINFFNISYKIFSNNWLPIIATRITVTVTPNGQIIGENAAKLSTTVGRVVKTHMSPTYGRWTEVPDELKERVWCIVSVSAFAFAYISI